MTKTEPVGGEEPHSSNSQSFRVVPLSADLRVLTRINTRLRGSMIMTDQLHGSSTRQHEAMAFLPCHVSRHLNHCRSIPTRGKISWSRWTFLRRSSTQLAVVERKPLVLKASEFQHLFEEGPREKIFAGARQ